MNMQLRMFNAVSEGICLIDLDGQILFCNQRLEQWLECSASELVGKSLYRLFPRFDVPHIQSRIQLVKRTHAPVIFSPQIHQYLFPCPMSDHNYRLQQTMVAYLEESDQILISVQDFTKQIRQHDMQKASNRQLQEELTERYILEREYKQLVAAIDQAAEAVIICNDRAVFQYVNHAFLQQTGWTKDEVFERQSYAKLRSDGDESFEQLVFETIRSGKKWQGQQQIQRKDGGFFTVSISFAPIVNDDGSRTHVVAIQEDLTEYLMLEDQYRRTQKQEALTTLVGGIAHDFNNLLSGMLGHIYLASREVKGLEKTPERLKKIQKSAYDAADIVKQLMTFSRRDQIEARDFPLQSFLKEMVKLIEHTVPESIEFILDFEQHPFAMHGDPDQLQQAVMNMVQNSVDACASVEHPAVEISLAMLDLSKDLSLERRYPALQYGQYAHLIIRDNGVGIHPDHQDRIFDPFFTTKQLGSGLGLATVMGCIRHHHGVIEVDSKLQQGTKIHIYLPLLVEDVAKTESVVQGLTNGRILLVDDDPLVRETSAELLQDLGHHVTTAIDGVDAVSLFKNHVDNFDLVIMDMVMPRMNGPSAVRHIRELRSDIPVIFATAYDRSVSLKDAERFDRSILVSKPFDPEVLNLLVTDVLRDDWNGQSTEH